MNTTIAIIIVFVLVAVAILMGRRFLSRESEPETEYDVPKEYEVPMESDVQKEADVPRNVRQFVERAPVIQQKYWTPNHDEKKRLLWKSIDDLRGRRPCDFSISHAWRYSQMVPASSNFWTKK